jgi:hypothetical protein
VEFAELHLGILATSVNFLPSTRHVFDTRNRTSLSFTLYSFTTDTLQLTAVSPTMSDNQISDSYSLRGPAPRMSRTDRPQTMPSP